MSVKTLGPKGGGFGGSPTSLGERNECQRGRWTLNRVDCDVPHWLGRGTNHRVWKPSLADAF